MRVPGMPSMSGGGHLVNFGRGLTEDGGTSQFIGFLALAF
jgi:hypothetical protein